MRACPAVAAIALTALLGRAFAAEGDWDDCKAENPERSIAGCTRIITAAREPAAALAIAHNNRGVAYKARQELLRAFADYTEALRLNPGYGRAYYNRALAHLDNKELARALEDLDAALRIEPTSVKALVRRAMLLAEHEQIEEALGDLASALKLDKDLQLKRDEKLAMKILAAKPPAEGQMAVLSVAVKLSPDDAELRNSRAALLYDARNYPEALAELNEAVRLVPLNAAYLANRCRVLTALDELARAVKDCDEAVSLAPKSGPVRFYRAIVHLRRSKPVEAERDLTSAIELMPGLPHIVVLRAQLYEDSGQRAKAIADYRAAAAMRPPANSPADSQARELAEAALRRLAGAGPMPPAPPRQSGEAARRPGETFRDCPQCPEMVVLPAGEFTMGSTSEESRPDDGEGPPHKVKVSAFAVGKLEVTVEEFSAFVKAAGYQGGDKCHVWTGRKWEDQNGSFRAVGFDQTPRHPAACINWNDARAYVAWLSQTTGKPYRLLTEAEWEYAARAGTTTPYSFGSKPEDLCKFANGADRTAKAKYSQWTTVANCNDAHVHTAPVGSFQPNAFGLYDLHGNVSEWVEDCFQDGYQNAPTDGAAVTADNCRLRVLRGGSWIGHPKVLRSASRLRRAPEDRYANIGFRVARGMGP